MELNEVMASNDLFPADDGELYDWVELYNPGGKSFDLSGWGLSDREDDIKFTFPDGTAVPAGDILSSTATS